MNKNLNDSLFAAIKGYFVNSSVLCFHSIIISALARNLVIKIYSDDDIKELCRHYGVVYNRRYHVAGQVFSLSDGKTEFIINKTKIFSDAIPDIYRKKNLKTIKTTKFDVPKGFVFKKSLLNPELIRYGDIRYPVVIKPVNGSMGKGVHLNIKSEKELFKIIGLSDYNDIIVEEQVYGDEYRIYLVYGRYYGAVKRFPPSIIGDGKSCVSKLIENKNNSKKRKNLPLIDASKAKIFLLDKGVSVDFIPKKGEIVSLGAVLGRSSGGDVYDLKDNLPKWVLDKIEVIGRDFSKNLCVGLDVIINKDFLYVIEVNGRPQLSSLINPDEGYGSNIADALVSVLFPMSKLLYEAGKGIANIKKAINIVRKSNKSLLLNPVFFDFNSLVDESNDLSYLAYNVPINSNRLMYRREAFSRNMLLKTWVNESGHQRWSITSRNKSYVFRENMPSTTSQSTRNLTNNKDKTKVHLSQHGISVPAGIFINSNDHDAALNWFDSLGVSPLVVVKPFNGAGGRGVVSNISSKDKMLNALVSLGNVDAVIEEHISGCDYRLFVVDGNFKFAIRRQPAHVVGDGVSTIAELIKKKNNIRRNNPYNGKYLLTLDEAALTRVQRSGYNNYSILCFGEKLYLQDIANIGAGGDSIDDTDIVHPDFIEIAEKAFASFNGLAFCGIDLITQDISQPASSQRYAIIEVNANCDFAIHHFPTKGKSRNAAGAILDALFPETTTASVITKHLKVVGKVQGVGYRKWLSTQAIMRCINGSVSNCQDGSVYATVQGAQSAVDDLVSAASSGPSKAVVKYIEIEDIFESGLYSGFLIR